MNTGRFEQELEALFKYRRESVIPECLLKGCHVCADLGRIDDKISGIYHNLSVLLEERQQLVKKPRYVHDTLINRMPMEILSSIFIFVKDAIFDYHFEEHPAGDHLVHKPPEYQPSDSPPLLLGAVCKKWRDVTLATPQLWTDIIVDLDKSVEGQTDMVKKWGSRSGALPLDITLLNSSRYGSRDKTPNECQNVLAAVRSLAVRWNGMALYIPGSFCRELLASVEDTLIDSVLFCSLYSDLEVMELQHPLRPRRLISDHFYGEIPFAWDRLISVQIEYASNDEILHIIQHAQNLKYCNGEEGSNSESGNFPIPAAPIINRSLIYLKTYDDILLHLTLPSLQQLDCRSERRFDQPIVDSIAEFFERSSAPLETFTVRFNVYLNVPFPPLERLPGMTSLFIAFVQTHHNVPDLARMDNFLLTVSTPQAPPDRILPRLKKITLELPNLSASSWSLLSRLFPDDTQYVMDSVTGMGFPPQNSTSPSYLDLPQGVEWPRNTRTFSQLSAVKTAGIDVRIVDWDGEELLVI